MRRLLLALALAGTFVSACGTQEPATSPAPVAQPTIEVVDLAGLDAALAKHRGHGVLLNFWALWCPPCVAELPELMEVAREFAPQGGRVLLVSFDLMIPKANVEKERARVTDYARQNGLDVPIMIYDATDYEAINERYDLPGGIPVTLAIDAQGATIDTQNGQADKARFQEMMRRAISGK